MMKLLNICMHHTCTSIVQIVIPYMIVQNVIPYTIVFMQKQVMSGYSHDSQWLMRVGYT